MSEPHTLAWVDKRDCSEAGDYRVYEQIDRRQRPPYLWGAGRLVGRTGEKIGDYRSREAAKEACEAHNQSQKAQQQ